MCRAELSLVFQVEADQVVEDQAAQVAASLGKFHDARDETTRGTIPSSISGGNRSGTSISKW